MKLVSLTQGYFAMVDDEDFERLSSIPWYALVLEKTVYACGRIKAGGVTSRVYMHRVILDAPRGMQVDHVDGNGWNNLRSNLRLATRAQNNANMATRKGTSQFKGVYLRGDTGKWCARVKQHGDVTYLGCFTNEEDAARAYDAAAIRIFGEFARLNFRDCSDV